MKNSTKSLFALAAAAALALGASAQPAPKVLVVDVAKLYQTHWKTADMQAKLQIDEQKAQEEIEKMNKEGNAIVEEFKSLNEAVNNPALSADGKKKATEDAQKKYEAIQKKQQEVQQFVQNTRNSLGQREASFRGMLLEDIAKVSSEMAKKKGANLLIDKSGPSGHGIPSLLYFDSAFEITEEVGKELNKDKPAGALTPTATPAASGSAAPAATPAVTVPGLAPKK
ncbi:MAG: OmpH family outer membrane protein [Opitutaceae bacterium]|nr:OmpH family outer membrane protein [Opitutaceae bacterium]